MRKEIEKIIKKLEEDESIVAYNTYSEEFEDGYTRGYKVALKQYEDSGAKYINFYGGDIIRRRDPRIQ